MFQIGQSLSCTLLVKWASCTQRNPVTGLWHSDCVWMIPKGCCCNCIQIYHPLPCSECHQKTPDLEQLSDIFPESQARVWRPGNPPRSRHTEHPLSPLLLGNRNRHFFTPNWANLIFISHLGHGPSKQMLFFFFFYPKQISWPCGFTLDLQQYLARELACKKWEQKSYTGPCTGL